MDKKLEKYVFHEAKIGDVFFRATLHQGHAAFYVEDATGWEAQVYLMGSGMPALFYAEAWTAAHFWIGMDTLPRQRARASHPPWELRRRGRPAAHPRIRHSR